MLRIPRRFRRMRWLAALLASTCFPVLLGRPSPLDLEPAPPEKIRAIRVELGPGGPALDLAEPNLLPEMALGERIAALDRWLADLAARDLFSGVVLVGDGDRVLLEQAYGLASREEGTPNLPTTRFNVGSIGKSFTQVAIAQLASAGKLTYDQTIAELLPDYPNPAVARRVTVRHLCAHTGGLGDFFGPRFEQTPKDRIREISDYLPLFVADSLRFEPGTQFGYSNAGYIVLGAIVERVSGQRYPEYLAEHIFAPAQMVTAGFLDLDRPAAERAVGYTRERDSDPWRPSTQMQPVRGSSAGGAYATARDLLRFANALGEGRLLPPGWTHVALDGPPPGRSGPAGIPDGPLGMGIAGGSPGWNSVLEAEGDRVLVITANLDPPIAEAIAQRMRPALLGPGAE